MPDLAWSHWLLATFAGGVVGMDSVSGPQIMVSRPIVSATLGGALFGDPAAGFLVGTVLELLGLRHPPLGAARYADLGPAGLMAGSGFAVAGGGVAPFTAVLVAGWALGWLGSRSVVALRRVNERLLGAGDRLAAVPGRIEVRQRFGLVLDFLRGAILTAAFLVPVLMLAAVTAIEAAEPGRTIAVACLALVVGAAAGAGGRNMPGGRRAVLLLAGGALAGLLWIAVA